MEGGYMEKKTNLFLFTVRSYNVKPRDLLFDHCIKDILKLH